MTRDHALMEELLSAAALDGLDPADQATLDRERAEHGVCADCAEIEAGFTEVAGKLALVLEPAPVREGMADQILSSPEAAADRAERIHVVAAARQDELSGRRERSGSWRAAVAVAAAVVLFAGGWFANGLRGGGTTAPRLVRFEGGSGQLAASFDPNEPGITVFGSGLAPLPEGKVYELWTIAGKTPTSAACFIPQDGSVLQFVDKSTTGADLMAVTIESSECPSAPTTQPVLTASLS